MGAIAVHRQGIAPMGRSCSLGSARDTAPYGSPAHCRASLRGDPGMLESVQPNPTSFCPVDSPIDRSEEHTSELQSLMRISYAVFCLKKKKINTQNKEQHQTTSHVHKITI